MNKREFDAAAHMAAREILFRNGLSFNEVHVDEAAEVIGKWLWIEPMNDIARQVENCQAGAPYGN